MRVTFLSVSAEMGGSEVSLLQLVRGIRELEPAWRLTVVAPREGPLTRRIRETGSDARVLPLPPALARLGEAGARNGRTIARSGAAVLAAAGSLPAYQRRLSSLLSELCADVVHTNGFKLHVLGARAASPDTPVVWHVHEYVSPRPLSRALLKRHLTRASAIVANSKSVAADLTSVFGGRAPIATVYNAVDLDEFTPDGPVEDLDRLAGMPSPQPGALRIGLVGTFGRWKGHETFLRALQRMKSSIPIRGYIIGAPVYDTVGSQYTLEELRELAGGLGIADRVGFTGFIERPASALRALDIVVHASTEPEPFGLVIAEAMACGCAVIVSAAGGAAELVRDGETALTHRPGDVEALARAIERAASDADLRRRLGHDARRAATALFDPAAFARAFADLYRTVQTREVVHQ